MQRVRVFRNAPGGRLAVRYAVSPAAQPWHYRPKTADRLRALVYADRLMVMGLTVRRAFDLLVETFRKATDQIVAVINSPDFLSAANASIDWHNRIVPSLASPAPVELACGDLWP